MTNQEKKAYLSRYKELNKAINQRIAELDQIRALAEKCTTTLSGMPHGGSTTREDTIVKLADKSRDIDDMIDELIDVKKQVIVAISSVQDANLYLLLMLRYIHDSPWSEIAEILGVKESTVRGRMHGKALENTKCCVNA